MENSADRYNCCDGAVFVGNRGTSTPFRGQQRLNLGAFGVGVKRGQTSFRRELTRVDTNTRNFPMAPPLKNLPPISSPPLLVSTQVTLLPLAGLLHEFDSRP